MLAIPFLIPSFYITQAYLATRVKPPVETEDVTLFTTDELLPFFRDAGIREDLFLIKKDTTRFCEATGTNFFTRGKAIISINWNFHKVDPEACGWAAKHELYHIKNNSCFTLPLVSAICSLATAILVTFVLSIIPGLVATVSAAIIGKTLFSRYVEGKADDFAIANSSEEELQAGRRYIKATLAFNLELRQENKALPLFYSSAGDSRWVFSQPSVTSRLKKIETALQVYIGVDDDEELKKIKELKTFIRNSTLGMAKRELDPIHKGIISAEKRKGTETLELGRRQTLGDTQS